MIKAIHIAHNLAKGGGSSFICTEFGTALNFETTEAAIEYINSYNLDRRIWKIVMLVEVPLA